MCLTGILRLYGWTLFLRQSTAYTSLYPSAPFHLSVSISCILMSLEQGVDLTFKSQASPLW